MTEEEKKTAQATVEANLKQQREEADKVREELEALLKTPVDSRDEAEKALALGEIEIRQSEVFIASQKQVIGEAERRIAEAEKHIAMVRAEQAVLHRRMLNPPAPPEAPNADKFTDDGEPTVQ